MRYAKGFFIFFLLFIILSLVQACNSSKDEYEASLRMLNITMKKDTQNLIKDDGILAAYFNEKKDYYCVSTYERDVEEIKSLESHEVCHALIKESYNHFCEVN